MVAESNCDVVLEKASKLYKGEALAPMVRASTIQLRTLALRYGADFVYTEELVDRSLSSCTRVVNDDGTIDFFKDTSNLSAKSLRKLDDGKFLLLRIDPSIEKDKLVCQIGSGEPELALAAARIVHRDVRAIDLNMGCPKVRISRYHVVPHLCVSPQKFSVSGGMGSALLSDPDRACRIIRSLTNELTSSDYNPIPVSGKIRLLKDITSTVEFATGLINAGAKAIAIHGRQPGDLAIQPADWKTLETTVSLLTSKFPSNPILVNGDFYTRDDFTSFCHKTGAAGVLLARPALYNLSIFRKPEKGDSPPFGYNSPLLMDRTEVIRDYIRESVRYGAHFKNVKYVVSEMMTNRRTPRDRVKLLPQLLKGGEFIRGIGKASSVQEICKMWEVDYDGCKQSIVESIAGEHKYSNEYILRNVSEVGGEVSATDLVDPPTKKPRIENSF